RADTMDTRNNVLRKQRPVSHYRLIEVFRPPLHPVQIGAQHGRWREQRENLGARNGLMLKRHRWPPFVQRTRLRIRPARERSCAGSASCAAQERPPRFQPIPPRRETAPRARTASLRSAARDLRPNLRRQVICACASRSDAHTLLRPPQEAKDSGGGPSEERQRNRSHRGHRQAEAPFPSTPASWTERTTPDDRALAPRGDGRW